MFTGLYHLYNRARMTAILCRQSNRIGSVHINLKKKTVIPIKRVIMGNEGREFTMINQRWDALL